MCLCGESDGECAYVESDSECASGESDDEYACDGKGMYRFVSG